MTMVVIAAGRTIQLLLRQAPWDRLSARTTARATNNTTPVVKPTIPHAAMPLAAILLNSHFAARVIQVNRGLALSAFRSGSRKAAVQPVLQVGLKQYAFPMTCYVVGEPAGVPFATGAVGSVGVEWMSFSR